MSSLIDKYVEVKMLSLHGERLADIVLTDQEKTDSYSFVPELSEQQKQELMLNLSDSGIQKMNLGSFMALTLIFQKDNL